MARIKIISNPYEKKITYTRFDELSDTWFPIDANNNANSKLLCNEFTAGFFPFKVKEIVDSIIKEYDDGEGPIIIEFEGTNDEFSDLEAVCSGKEYADSVRAEKSNRYIENAREILPDIIDIFSELKSIIRDSIGEDEIAYDLKRFSDASSDVIPICVIGNYSAGKSTFINALIGSEILPSGENPVTAKVFKITESHNKDCASVGVKFNGKESIINFSQDGFHLGKLTAKNEFTEKISSKIPENSGLSLSAMVNCVLGVINDFSSEPDNDHIGNMIEVNVPFNSCISQKSNSPFMIFDTPGSNSASNVKHLEVLKEAMKGMSNGIPVFISESSKLDTTDNEDLFNIIKDIDNLDSRFTMIVVNKADLSNLPSNGFTESEEKKILRLFIPKNLYSGGIYYVSSLMGLGSKIDGVFENESDAKRYKKQKADYSEPQSEDYISLYRYNIMPGQIKQNAVRVSSECNNRVLANSGLYCVECDIATFAEKYSSYDKCTQSQSFLNSILSKTTCEIESKKAEVENEKSEKVDKFNRLKEQLINSLDNDCETFFDESKAEYSFAMEDTYTKCESSFGRDELEAMLTDIIERLKKEKGYDNLKSYKSQSRKVLVSNLLENSKNIFKDKFDKDSFKKLGDTFSENLKNVDEDSDDLKEAKKEISELASNELLGKITYYYEEATEKAQRLINENSREYWENKTKEARELLLNTVSGSKGINEDEQAELSKIILEYPGIALFDNKADEIFAIENFRRKLVFDDIVKLKLEKLSRTYNDETEKFVHEIKDLAEKDHASGFHLWMETLLSELKSNIVSYNKILMSEQLYIEKLEENIRQLEEKRSTLIRGSYEIEKMMLWKEN